MDFITDLPIDESRVVEASVTEPCGECHQPKKVSSTSTNIVTINSISDLAVLFEHYGSITLGKNPVGSLYIEIPERY